MVQLNTYDLIYCNKMTKVIDRTSNMLDAHPQDKPYGRLHVLNACEQSSIIMMTGGSKMSKIE